MWMKKNTKKRQIIKQCVAFLLCGISWTPKKRGIFTLFNDFYVPQHLYSKDILLIFGKLRFSVSHFWQLPSNVQQGPQTYFIWPSMGQLQLPQLWPLKSNVKFHQLEHDGGGQTLGGKSQTLHLSFSSSLAHCGVSTKYLATAFLSCEISWCQ